MASIADPVPLTPSRFRLLRPLARGGFSAVYLAHDEELNRIVVVKAMRGKYAERSWARKQILFEAEVTARLEHPGVVPVYSRGVDEAGYAYFTMRYVRGEPLSAAIAGLHAPDNRRSRRRVLNRLVDRLVDVCYTVEFAHRRGVTHRDLTPANVMLGEHGETLVLDWGLAKLVPPTASATSDDPFNEMAEDSISPAIEPLLEDVADHGEDEDEDEDEARTEAGVSLGTPRYMSPEQAAGDWERFGPSSDVFALGAVLYELLTGRAPFDDDDRDRSEELARRGVFEAPRVVDRRVPAALETVCLRAMMREPSARYSDPIALGSDLARWVVGQPISIRRDTTLRDWKKQLST